MNKLVQLIIGFICIAISVGVLIYIILKVLPTASVSVNAESSVKVLQPEQVLDTALIEKIKKLNRPANIPVKVGNEEVSRNNPFANY